MMRVKEAVGCEVAHYCAAEVDGEFFHDQVIGSSHLDEQVRSLNGAPLYLGQELAYLGPERWSIASPLPVHYNRFAKFHEDLDVERLRRAAVWQAQYEPAGIEDQLRGLFYAEGHFIGYVAAFRGEPTSFREEDRGVADSLASKIRDDLILATSIEKGTRSEASCHMVCDENGKLIYASETARVWLNPRRAAELRTALLFGDIPVVDGMRLAVEVLEPHGWRYVHLWATSTIRHRADAVLTHRQRLIGRFAARGLTNAEIADLLDLSISTVKYHLRRIFDELCIESRRQLREIRW